ncbi:STAS/SEC14 domain-containing protein [Robertkochia sediminum]|uniref:STAS/SEC14 domain-containing protein n=1 Tax=Robertkochia sediminum TaxID=2785326 RepID=UPI0019319AF7|nr:STAS/SEC14 domain-containing protein [Robertkochia sediminum]MBL7474123.1 STAS/SEC14 domain-containing protein [Robertkochia sediminum]
MSSIPQDFINVERSDLGTFYFYSNMVIGILEEGTILDLDTTSKLIALSERNFGLRDFVYISLRLHSYSVDPTIYPYLTEMKNLKGIAIVSEKASYRKNFEVEKQFYAHNMRIFNDLDEAILWSRNLIE